MYSSKQVSNVFIFLRTRNKSLNTVPKINPHQIFQYNLFAIINPREKFSLGWFTKINPCKVQNVKVTQSLHYGVYKKGSILFVFGFCLKLVFILIFNVQEYFCFSKNWYFDLASQRFTLPPTSVHWWWEWEESMYDWPLNETHPLSFRFLNPSHAKLSVLLLASGK